MCMHVCVHERAHLHCYSYSYSYSYKLASNLVVCDCGCSQGTIRYIHYVISRGGLSAYVVYARQCADDQVFVQVTDQVLMTLVFAACVNLLQYVRLVCTSCKT